MGQDNSRRKVQHQEIEVWELYENDGRNRSRQTNRSNRNTGTVKNNNEEVKIIRIYEQEQSDSRPRASKAVNRQENSVRNSKDVYRENACRMHSAKRRRARRRRKLLYKTSMGLFMTFLLVMIYFFAGQIYQMKHRSGQGKVEVLLPDVEVPIPEEDTPIAPPVMRQDFLEINEYSRPGTPMSAVNSIFVHYTANPGTSARQNRSYFANLAQTHERSASAHLIIGYEGEVVQCIPFDEQAYAVMTRNEDSISIECCYLSEDGSFTQATYDTLVHTLAWLLDEYDLSTEDILRHYDCGGKLCPLYYAENEDAWEQLRRDVADYMEQTSTDSSL